MQGEEVVIVSDDGTEHVFPAGFDPKKAAAIVSGGGGAEQTSEPEQPQSKGFGPAIATGMAYGTPLLRSGLEQLATNPSVPKVAASIGRGIGAVTSLPASLSGFGSMQRGVWAGGRSGWFTGKLAQRVAAPIAQALQAAPINAALQTTKAVAPGIAAISATGEALSALNSPKAFATLADAMTPEAREKLKKYMESRTK